MGVWSALLWGGFCAAALLVGQALATPLRGRPRATGLLMAFGAGTLLSSVAYELIPRSNLEHVLLVTVAALTGGLVYFLGNKLVEGAGGAKRKAIAGPDGGSSGTAMFLGALLDGVPESFILGSGLAMGGDISAAFVVAVFVSNVPEGAAGTISLRETGVSSRTVTLLWTSLVVASALSAAAGFGLADVLGADGVVAQAFAAGAMLVMLTDSMIPEAVRHGGRTTGLFTVLGYLVAAALSSLE